MQVEERWWAKDKDKLQRCMRDAKACV